jgi:two-component system NtrC family sensor kinase
MQAQLVQSAKLASLGELVAGIAHEINNPLSGILIFSSLATKAPDLSSEVKSNLDVVISETKRCAKIVHGLLEFSRESIPEKRIDSINRILKQSLHLITQQSLFQNIAIKYELDEELPDISVDSDQIQQVFFNLIVNAGQAMEKGGVLTLVSELDRKKGMIIIKIIDNGVGINEEHLSRIFDPFFSTKPEMGSGLGLSISYGIVENHAGQIEVQSITGKGTQFTISLPLDKDTIKP